MKKKSAITDKVEISEVSGFLFLFFIFYFLCLLFKFIF